MKKLRIYGVTTESKEAQIRKWAEELGIDFSVFCALAVWIGAKKLAKMHNLEKEEISMNAEEIRLKQVKWEYIENKNREE